MHVYLFFDVYLRQINVLTPITPILANVSRQTTGNEEGVNCLAYADHYSTSAATHVLSRTRDVEAAKCFFLKVLHCSPQFGWK